jgi:hypothetical protein
MLKRGCQAVCLPIANKQKGGKRSLFTNTMEEQPFFAQVVATF